MPAPRRAQCVPSAAMNKAHTTEPLPLPRALEEGQEFHGPVRDLRQTAPTFAESRPAKILRESLPNADDCRDRRIPSRSSRTPSILSAKRQSQRSEEHTSE